MPCRILRAAVPHELSPSRAWRRQPVGAFASRCSGQYRTAGRAASRWPRLRVRWCGASRYAREDQEWDALLAAGWGFLTTQARLERTTSYTEMNTVLSRRTGVRECDFSLDSEHHAMGELIGQLSQRSFAQAGLLISVLVQYLNADDAGPGSTNLPGARNSCGRVRRRTRC